ncbi:MAG: chitobiase/beta-hexosaminidase C-terminal domain-containing protein [Bacteroidales bacterium]|nr:chitobiase/beta-hexosaminidase C-terminal domain-containing protein [Bacteroidales bacterium]
MKSIFTCFFILIIPFIIHAQVKLPSHISDHMVLQQKSIVPIWGKAKTMENITLFSSWDKRYHHTQATESGDWKLMITTPKAGGPYYMIINETHISDILIGEVWLCSGQSNMQWPLNKSENGAEEIKRSENPQLRLFQVSHDYSDIPKSDCQAEWQACSAESVADFSAVAYYFGKEINQTTGFPVGLIHSSWSGTPAEAWTQKKHIEKHPKLKYFTERFEVLENNHPATSYSKHHEPGVLFNAMIAPLIPYSIKGAIWYQGESNRMEHELYDELLETLINNWRTAWNQGAFPFYFVQLAPFNYDNAVVGAALRDAQRRSMNNILNTGMAVTMDIGDTNNIHPKNKKDVGQRLAAWALTKDYGIQQPFSGPLYRSMEIDGNRITLSFDHTESGIISKNGPPLHFKISGKDRVFHAAEASIINDQIVVHSKLVKSPVAVRFAFNNTDIPNIYNKDGFPASTFRTDEWEINTETVQISARFDKTKQRQIVELTNYEKATEIRYTLDDTKPHLHSPKYTEPIKLKATANVQARAFIDGTPSEVVNKSTIMIHKAVGKEIQLKYLPNQKYRSKGNLALIDGLRGGRSFWSGGWTGFEGSDMDAIIDLGETVRINQLIIGCLHEINSWIFFPQQIQIKVSADGLKYETIATNYNPPNLHQKGEITTDFTFEINMNHIRYIKIRATNIGQCPAWHEAKDHKAWLFIDEIILN